MQTKRILLSLLLGMGLLSLALYSLSSLVTPVRAATFTVDTTSDDITSDSFCSLREALVAANGTAATDCGSASPGPDTIVLAATSYTFTNPSSDEDLSADGDLDILDSVTIVGQGITQTVINASTVDRIFDVITGTVVISGMTLENGSIGAAGGGGIRAANGRLTLINVLLRFNTSGANGGAILVTGPAMVELQGVESAIRDNNADWGGGVLLEDGVFLLTEGTIAGNTASSGGGGVTLWPNPAVFTMTGGVITNNVAGSAAGGGLRVDNNGSASLQGGTIISNSSATNGGGIAVLDGKVTLTGTLVTLNKTPGNGGGVYIEDTNTTNTGFTLNSGRIINNDAASGDGGGIHVQTGWAQINGGEILSNVAAYGGGILAFNPTAVVTQSGVSTIAYNSASINGGGLYSKHGKVIIQSGRVYSNSAVQGGGFYVSDADASLELQGGSTERNYASEGGGIFANASPVNISGGEVANNIAVSSGGGIYSSLAPVTLSGGDVQTNSALLGGGVYLLNSSAAFTTTGIGRVAFNEATNFGAGVYINAGRMVMQGGSVYSNTTCCNGGGVYVSSAGASFSQQGGLIQRNAASFGAGLFVSAGQATLESGVINQNSAVVDGGGVYVADGSLTQQGGEISDNSADDGGGIYINNGWATMQGGTVLSNSAIQRGGGVFLLNATAAFTQSGVSTIAHNLAGGVWGGGGLYIDAGRAVMQGGTVFSNSATSRGGGVYVNTGDFTQQGGLVDDNLADEGGGIYIGLGQATLSGGRVTDNYATTSGGGLSNNGAVVLDGGQLDNNQSGGSGGGLYQRGPAGVLTHTGSSTITLNRATVDGGGVYVDDDGKYVVQPGGLILDNNALNAGGGLVVRWGQAGLTGAEVLSNSAAGSGGILVSGGGGGEIALLTMTGGELSYNEASAIGGGLVVGGDDTAIISGTRILYNRAPDFGAVGVNSGAVTVTNSCIVFNSGTSVDWGGGSPINALDNWWGRDDGPGGAGTGHGDTVGINVEYVPFLSSPPPGCPNYPLSVAGQGILYPSFQKLGNLNSRDVALGDLDLDGDLDAVAANSSPNVVWLNNGSGIFNEQPDPLGSGSSQGVALGDLNSDGAPDVVIVNAGSNGVVWLNDGQGSFNTTLSQTLEVSNSRAVAIANFDPLNGGNTSPDVFIVNGGGNPDQLWFNNGSGVLQTPTSLGGQDGQAVAVGDLNNDTYLDVVVGNGSNQPNQIMLNDGYGVFSVTPGLGLFNTQAVAVGDILGDPLPDVVVGNGNGQPDQVWLNQGGNFTLAQSLGTSDTRGLTLADLDDDGDNDLIVAAFGGSRLYINQGGTLVPDQFLGTANTEAAIVGDLDGDGDEDVFAANEGGNTVFFNQNVQSDSANDSQSWLLYFGQGLTLSLEIPAGALRQTTIFTYSAIPTPTQSSANNFSFAGRAFNLNANVSDPFSRPVTVTLYYDPAVVDDPDSLFLRLWAGGGWLDPANSCDPNADPATHYIRNTAQHHFKVRLCHLTEFGLFQSGEGGSSLTFVPVVMKD
jgi:CSLREA domain-containing protein